MKEPDSDAHWRDSARQARFFFVDATAAFPILIMLLHIKLWTFIATACSILFFAILERFKFTIPVFIRWIKGFIAGPIKLSRPWWRE
jgi:intracellular multiplication protein IcmT